ncbi:IclR family transcriptional regulator, partial [Streptomyces platensis subsp. clarensis]|nr:IclR family transcriptional regulator [Streptomyces platensis subsp. clarensis]
MTDAQIARETGLPPVQLGHMLAMLRREGYVEQVTDGAYVIGESLLLLGSGGDRD